MTTTTTTETPTERWIAYCTSTDAIYAVGASEEAVLTAVGEIGEDPAGEDFPWVATAPATERLLAAATIDGLIRWRMVDGVADLID